MTELSTVVRDQMIRYLVQRNITAQHPGLVANLTRAGYTIDTRKEQA